MTKIALKTMARTDTPIEVRAPTRRPASLLLLALAAALSPPAPGSAEDDALSFIHSPAVSREGGLERAFDEYLLGTLYGCLRFERTLGELRTRVGSLRACQGRVDQLLAERRLARTLKKPFAKVRELRALVRRMPSFTG